MQRSVGTNPDREGESNCAAAVSSHLVVLPTVVVWVGAVVLLQFLLQLTKQFATPNAFDVPTTCQSILTWIQTEKDCRRHKLLSTLQELFPCKAPRH